MFSSLKFDRQNFRASEADLLAEFYLRARQAGIEVYLEVILPSQVHRSRGMRADAIVVHGDAIVFCVEVKREGRIITGYDGNSRQSRAYIDLKCYFGIETIWINSRAGIDDAVREISEKLRGTYGASEAHAQNH